MFLCELIKGVEKFTLPLSLLNCAPCAPSGLHALPIVDTHFTRLCAFILINKPLTRIFLSCVVSIVRYSLTTKNLGKAIRRHFIPLKVIKYASNVIDSYLYNIIIKDLDKEKQVLRRIKNNISKSHFQEK